MVTVSTLDSPRTEVAWTSVFLSTSQERDSRNEVSIVIEGLS